MPPSFTSSMPAVMLPFPSAVKLPTRAMKLPLMSVPLIWNTYEPLRLAAEKLPVGGGAGGPRTPELHAPDNRASAIAQNGGRGFIPHVPAGRRVNPAMWD